MDGLPFTGPAEQLGQLVGVEVDQTASQRDAVRTGDVDRVTSIMERVLRR